MLKIINGWGDSRYLWWSTSYDHLSMASFFWKTRKRDFISWGQDTALYSPQKALLKGLVSLTHMKAPKLDPYNLRF